MVLTEKEKEKVSKTVSENARETNFSYITNTLNSHDMLNPTKVYFPINILDEQFERIESTEIEDIDIFTKRRYKTTFSEYIRL